MGEMAAGISLQELQCKIRCVIWLLQARCRMWGVIDLGVLGLARKVEARGVATSVSRKEQPNRVGNRSVPAAPGCLYHVTVALPADLWKSVCSMMQVVCEEMLT